MITTRAPDGANKITKAIEGSIKIYLKDDIINAYHVYCGNKLRTQYGQAVNWKLQVIMMQDFSHSIQYSYG